MADRATQEEQDFDKWWGEYSPILKTIHERGDYANPSWPLLESFAWTGWLYRSKSKALAGARLAAEPQSDDVGMLICGKCGNGPIMPSEIRCGECEPKLNTRCPHCQVWFRPKEWADDNLARVPDHPPAEKQAEAQEVDSKFPVKWGHEKLVNVLEGAAGLLDVIKGEWVEEWSEWDQSVRNGITRQLLAGASATPAPSELAELIKAADYVVSRLYSTGSADPRSIDALRSKLIAWRIANPPAETP